MELCYQPSETSEATVLGRGETDGSGKVDIKVQLSTDQQMRGRFTALVRRGDESKTWRLSSFPEEDHWRIYGPRTSSPATRADGTRAGELRTFNEELNLAMVWCPPGEFTMGSPPSEKDREDNEDQVEVTLTGGFWLGRTEVTQGQWEAVMGTEPWKGQTYVREGADYPATYVSWEDAVKYCEALTKREVAAGRLPRGFAYQLPTEAQWEYACRAETRTSYSFGNDAIRLGEYAWFDFNAYDIDEKYAHGVGTKRETAWHLYDMHGNVWEWCRDWYEAKLPGGRDPYESTVGSGRVFRGGSWYFSPRYCRSANRSWYAPSYRSHFLGFRVSNSVK